MKLLRNIILIRRRKFKIISVPFFKTSEDSIGGLYPRRLIRNQDRRPGPARFRRGYDGYTPMFADSFSGSESGRIFQGEESSDDGIDDLSVTETSNSDDDVTLNIVKVTTGAPAGVEVSSLSLSEKDADNANDVDDGNDIDVDNNDVLNGSADHSAFGFLSLFPFRSRLETALPFWSRIPKWRHKFKF